MSFPETTPDELFARAFRDREVAESAWCVRWDRYGGDPAELAARLLPEEIEFETSGSTGPPQRWLRRREALWAEAEMLASLLAVDEPDGIACFVPPVHLYGGLTSILVPAILRLPVWFRPGYFGAMPKGTGTRWAVIGTPWVFSLLLQHRDWVLASERLTVMHGGARLPSQASDLLDTVSGDRTAVVEVFGCTEAGGVATRRWQGGALPPWTLFDDVDFAGSLDTAGERPLHVRTPRMAYRPGQAPAASWELDDHVQVLDERRFEFAGRRSRLVNINGRRHNLDELEDRFRRVADCADFALVPVEDAMVGEHVELLIVPGAEKTLADVGLAAGFAALGVRPKRVREVSTIDRSETGKLRHLRREDPVTVKE